MHHPHPQITSSMSEMCFGCDIGAKCDMAIIDIKYYSIAQ